MNYYAAKPNQNPYYQGILEQAFRAMNYHAAKPNQNPYYQGILEQAFREDQGDYSAQPQKDDAVLGGNNPLTDAAVLGTGKIFGRLFDRFNDEAQAINGTHLWLKISPKVALGRNRKSMPLDDIKIKVHVAGESGDELLTTFKGWWQFAGYLKHDGLLFGNTAKYDPAGCEVALRAIAHRALVEGWVDNDPKEPIQGVGKHHQRS